MKIEISTATLPERNVVYLTHIGPFAEMGKAFGQLAGWAGQAGLFQNPNTKSVCVYYDDPKTTPPEKLRTDCCFTAPEDFKISGDVKKMKIEGGLFVVGKCTIDKTEFAEAWGKVMKYMSDNGYEMDNRKCYEFYHEEANEKNGGKFTLEICQPIKEK